MISEQGSPTPPSPESAADAFARGEHLPPAPASVRRRWPRRLWIILFGCVALLAAAAYRGRQFLRAAESHRQQRLVAERLAPFGADAQEWQGQIVQVTFVGGLFQAEALPWLSELPQLSKLVFVDTPLNDAALARLPDLPQLRELVVIHAPLTDQGLVHVARFTQLTYLQLTETQMTGNSLSPLNQLTRLRRLDLRQSLLTDESLEQLYGLRQLSQLYLSGAGLTPEAVRDLKLALPTTTVSFVEN